MPFRDTFFSQFFFSALLLFLSFLFLALLFFFEFLFALLLFLLQFLQLLGTLFGSFFLADSLLLHLRGFLKLFAQHLLVEGEHMAEYT